MNLESTLAILARDTNGSLFPLNDGLLAGTDIVCENGSMDNEPDDKLILPKLSSPKLVLPFNNVQAFDDELDKFVRIVTMMLPTRIQYPIFYDLSGHP
ncbi:hypothetical protein DERP_000140 [Dermatophagoides pteronyssinus]|uniref:Uncharacterized protein n=1 Tax=Dermatophagoides pteronyssinus TaxID=6956 RepID=A0ABQ8IZB3_DERPT|nr:hypothetical protein DERP_000140 [Dermatophagoides pteronyssinus]